MHGYGVSNAASLGLKSGSHSDTQGGAAAGLTVGQLLAA